MQILQTMSQEKYNQSVVGTRARCRMPRLLPFVRLEVVNAIDRTERETEDE